jgi:hypothetical protein
MIAFSRKDRRSVHHDDLFSNRSCENALARAGGWVGIARFPLSFLVQNGDIFSRFAVYIYERVQRMACSSAKPSLHRISSFLREEVNNIQGGKING